MSWTLTNLIVQTVGGAFGGLAVAAVVHEHSLGLFGNTLVGLVAGLLSGYFLQGVIGTIVTGAGTVNPSTAVESAVSQALGGIASGACLALVVGLVWHSVVHHRAQKDQVQP